MLIDTDWKALCYIVQNLGWTLDMILKEKLTKLLQSENLKVKLFRNNLLKILPFKTIDDIKKNKHKSLYVTGTTGISHGPT